MIVVYVAGPFRAAHQWGVAENIRAAERVGLLVANCGAMPLIPHANTAHFHGLKDEQFWVDGTKELAKRCDAGVFLPSWRISTGSIGEWRLLGELGKPRLSLAEISPLHHAKEIDDFIHWLGSKLNGQENHPEKR